jgi:hypothetical protein
MRKFYREQMRTNKSHENNEDVLFWGFVSLLTLYIVLVVFV